MRKSKLSPQLRSELKKYTLRLQRLDEQDKKVRQLMTQQGVFDDSDALSEAAGRIPAGYLRFGMYERLFELRQENDGSNNGQ